VFVNFRWKISIHMVGIGGITGMLLGLSSLFLLDLRVPIIISILIAGILGSARLRMGAHQPSQVYVGYLVGIFCEYLMLNI
jgi:membrane-associated phospholipid phosphatase